MPHRGFVPSGFLVFAVFQGSNIGLFSLVKFHFLVHLNNQTGFMTLSISLADTIVKIKDACSIAYRAAVSRLLITRPFYAGDNFMSSMVWCGPFCVSFFSEPPCELSATRRTRWFRRWCL